MRTPIKTLLAALFLVSACIAQPQQGTLPAVAGQSLTDPAAMSGVPKSQTPTPTALVPVDGQTFIIGAEDVIRITVVVSAAPQMPQEYVVRPDGYISVPLIGEVKAGGITPRKLEDIVTQKLKDAKMYLDPSVTVGVQQVNSRKIYITGEVNKPGPMMLVVPTKVSEALAQAGGFKEFAKTKDVRIMRNGVSLKYNDKEVSTGKNLSQDILLEPGDHIYVR